MNIFILDENIDKCAEYHVDKHIVKMPLEAAQMLCTNLWIDTYLGYRPYKIPKEELQLLRKKPKPEGVKYAFAMPNHPCTIWARSSLDNYEWLFCYAHALNEEYRYRYGKEHKSVHEVVLRLPDPLHLPQTGLTEFAMAMPDELKTSDVVSSYRAFYHKDKATFASWKYREKPEWWDENEADYNTRITA
jgi:hypothetical protein